MSKNLGMDFDPKHFDRSQLVWYAILTPFALFMGAPILYIIMTAFKPLDELLVFPPRFFVYNPTFDNFRLLLTNSSSVGLSIYRYLINSIIVTVSVTSLSVLFSAMAGYVLSKKHFRGKNLLFEINKIALMFVSVAVTIPRFLVIGQLGIVNTIWAHILPIMAIPVGLFLIKQFIDQIPNELIEAARVDGAGDFHIFRVIILPLTKPAIVTVAILAFQASWNNSETSALFVSLEEIQTFAYYLSTLTNVSNSLAGAGVAAAGALIMFLPNLLFFIFLQSQVMDTMAHSGMK